MASGTCERRIKGRTHGRSDQQKVLKVKKFLPTRSRPHMALLSRQPCAIARWSAKVLLWKISYCSGHTMDNMPCSYSIGPVRCNATCEYSERNDI
jgi:hypothetical protein